MPETIDIKADDEIDTLTTLIEAKTGNHVLPAEAIREAVAYWLDSHEVAECDGGVTTPSLPARPTLERADEEKTFLGELYPQGEPGRPFYDDSELNDDAPLGTIRGDDGTIPKR